ASASRPSQSSERSRTRSAARSSLRRQGNSRAIQPSPERLELPVVGPHAIVALSRAQHGELSVREIRFVLGVAFHPVEDVVPPRRRQLDESDGQAIEHKTQALPQMCLGEEKANLAQYRSRRRERSRLETPQVALRRSREAVRIIDETDQDVGVDEDQRRLRSFFRTSSWTCLRSALFTRRDRTCPPGGG